VVVFNVGMVPVAGLPLKIVPVTAKFVVAMVAAALFNVSPVKALPALGLPVAPFTDGKRSFTASIGAAPTVIVVVVVAQLVGFNFSHNLYVIG
jgi:hypothetical protein